MRTKAGYFKIGLFVLTLTGVLIAGILWLGANTLFQEMVLLETYMDESVQGLAVGSPVMQRGVQIGTVKQITFVPREYEMPTDSVEAAPYQKMVMVIMSIDKAHFAGAVSEHDVRDILQQWINNGLRLKLSPQGITGIYYLEADFVDDPKRFGAMTVPWTPKYHFVPSTTSLFRSFTQSADSLFQSLSKVPFEDIAKSLLKTSDSLQKSFESITKEIQDAQLIRVREETIRLLTQLQQASNHATALLDPDAPNTGSANIPQFINQINVTLKRIDQFVSIQQPELERIITNFTQASANVREMTENAKKDPASILFSVPPKPMEVAP